MDADFHGTLAFVKDEDVTIRLCQVTTLSRAFEKIQCLYLRTQHGDNQVVAVEHPDVTKDAKVTEDPGIRQDQDVVLDLGRVIAHKIRMCVPWMGQLKIVN